jgi:hypothetical protein
VPDLMLRHDPERVEHGSVRLNVLDVVALPVEHMSYGWHPTSPFFIPAPLATPTGALLLRPVYPSEAPASNREYLTCYSGSGVACQEHNDLSNVFALSPAF